MFVKYNWSLSESNRGCTRDAAGYKQFNLIRVNIFDTKFNTFCIVKIVKGYTVSIIYPAVILAIINKYSQFKLNVGKNLFLAMQQIVLDNKSLSIDNQVNYYRENFPEFEKYYPDIKKYLVFI